MTIMHGTPYIIVCPMFFTYPRLQSYPQPNTCAKLTPDKTRFEEKDLAHFIQYRMWILLEEIGHYYITMTTHAELDVYGINECVWMDGEDSSRNPGNYRFYAASEYPSPPPFIQRKRC